jgi:hypothetical protein
MESSSCETLESAEVAILFRARGGGDRGLGLAWPNLAGGMVGLRTPYQVGMVGRGAREW